MRLRYVLVVPLLLVMSGCAANPETTALEECQRIAPRAVIDLRGHNSFRTAEFEDVKSVQRGDDKAWDITGTVALELASGATVTDDFKCLAQHVDGKDYAAILNVSGTDVRPNQ